ncbi:hypothetical protein [Phyllobacterium sp. K27]
MIGMEIPWTREASDLTYSEALVRAQSARWSKGSFIIFFIDGSEHQFFFSPNQSEEMVLTALRARGIPYTSADVAPIVAGLATLVGLMVVSLVFVTEVSM